MRKDCPALVIFLDCVGYDEVDSLEWMSLYRQGKIVSGVPRVTPYVISGILTGATPPYHGVLCPTRWQEENINRPRCETIIEQAAQTRRVLNYEIPLTENLVGKYLTNVGSGAVIDVQPRPVVFRFPRPAGRLWKDDTEKIFQSHVDYIRCVFGTIRNLLRHDNYDLCFLAIRDADSFGHFLYEDQRRRLIYYLDIELEDTAKMGDIPILFFSDHGIEKKTDTFYLNKWLQEEGWLELEIFMPGWERAMAKDDDKMEMISPHSPFVHVKENSFFISPDAYDSGVKSLRADAPIDELKQAIMATGLYRSIQTPQELYGEGPFLAELGIDLVLDRADGILVSGNVHPALNYSLNATNYCQGNLRTGVHNRFGMWGSNIELGKGDYHPAGFYDVLRQFIDEYAPLANEAPTTSADDDKVSKRLKDLGYI